MNFVDPKMLVYISPLPPPFTPPPTFLKDYTKGCACTCVCVCVCVCMCEFLHVYCLKIVVDYVDLFILAH